MEPMPALGQNDRDDASAGMPGGLRAALAAALAALVGGAVLLLAGRGDALLLDLAHFSRQMLCF